VASLNIHYELLACCCLTYEYLTGSIKEYLTSRTVAWTVLVQVGDSIVSELREFYPSPCPHLTWLICILSQEMHCKFAYSRRWAVYVGQVNNLTLEPDLCRLFSANPYYIVWHKLYIEDE